MQVYIPAHDTVKYFLKVAAEEFEEHRLKWFPRNSSLFLLSRARCFDPVPENFCLVGTTLIFLRMGT